MGGIMFLIITHFSLEIFETNCYKNNLYIVFFWNYVYMFRDFIM